VRNGVADRVRAVRADATDPAALAEAGLTEGTIERVLMNPPFNDSSHASPEARRRLAHAAGHGSPRRWIESAARLLRPKGTLTLIWRADTRQQVLDTLSPAFGNIAVLPVRPGPDTAAIRVLVRAIKGDAVSLSDLPDLILNDSPGRPSRAAEAILRNGATLPLAQTPDD